MFSLKLLGGASIETPSGPLTGRAVQRHRLALLALLGRASARGVGRDKLITYLWPEVDSDKGRRLLSDSIYRINQAIGKDVIFGVSDELRLDAQHLPSDVAEFEEAVTKGEWERVVELYAGPFLDGFFLADAPDFERWVEAERDRLAREYARALEALAEAAEAERNRARAAEWWRRLAACDPCNSRVALRLMQALDAAGERAAALQHARTHALLLREEFGAEADGEIVALAERLRAEPAMADTSPPASPNAAPPTPFPSIPFAEGVPGAADDPVSTHVGTPRPRERLTRPSLVLGVTTALLLLLGVALFWQGRKAPAAPAPSASSAASATIAVLPFADMTPGGDHEYFSDGITEELINSLAQVEGLRVAARTSTFAFKGRQIDVREVGDKLNVATVLEGSVRRTGNRLRISAQLINVADGYHMWSKTYEREMEDVFTIQEEISRAIVETLKGRLAGAAAAIERTVVEPAAYDLYLKGRHAWHRRTEEGIRRALSYFEQAVEQAPAYARAHAGLADAYAVLGFYDYLSPREAFPKAEAAAKRALELDPTLAAPHSTLGYVALYYRWDWRRAEREFQRAIQLDPNYSTAHQWYANFLTAMGRFDEAEREMRRAQELDPLSLIANAALGWVYYYAGDYQRAVEQSLRTLELDPNFRLAYLWGGLAYEQLGRTDEAIQMLERSLALSAGSAINVAALAHAHAAAGSRGRATEMLTAMLPPEERYVPSYEVAKVYLALGQEGEALDWLERAYEQRSHSMAFLKVDPQLTALGAHPRYRELLRRVGHRP